MKCQAVVVRLAFVLLITFLFILPRMARGQSLTTGDVAGTIMDPSGAAVQGATVNLRNDATGVTSTTTSNATGACRFPFLNPGNYTVTVNMHGFALSVPHAATVAVGQASTVNIQLQLAAAATTTVEVSGVGSVIQTENANVSTTISPEIVSNIPNPGNDLTYYVQIAPGATMNTQAGYGNTALFGISGTSNYFTVDGLSENDPFLNLNNSGPSNLLLGTNEIETATVVNNGYSGEYGTLAGANVNYVTKSGTNKIHGNLEYFWNGRVLNANDWFNNNTGTPRPFDNANQWAASIGGPIKKNKTFFFVDQEGLRLLIPVVEPVNVPSPQFQAATLSALASDGNAAEIPYYNKLFSIYNGASGFGRATNTLPAGGCDSSVSLGGAPCGLVFQSNVHNLTTEWLLTGRVDQTFGTRDHAFIHFKTDHGLQASYTDPLNPILNAQSVQPDYEGQIQENHTFGSFATNQFIVGALWYRFVFQPPNIGQALSLQPYETTFSSGQFFTPGGTSYQTWPQGRAVTQYQIEDDLAWQKGHHTLKFGVDFRRNDITDYTPGGFDATIPAAAFATEASFLAGSADTFLQAFATRPTEPLAFYSLGLYAQDEWALRPDFKLILSLRAEHNSNPICVTNCFAHLADQFSLISHDPTQPYNQAIVSGLHQALPNYQGIAWEPRLGFAWQPLGNKRTVVRGGVGIFADLFPAALATDFDTNSPVKNTFSVPGGYLGPLLSCPTLPCAFPSGATIGPPVAPGVPGNESSLASASNAAFVTGFNSGLNLSQISSIAPAFTPPAMYNAAHKIKYPIYDEWNLEVQHALTNKMSVSADYVGNHGSDLAAFNPNLNAYCGTACLGTLSSNFGLTTPLGSFVGLPTTATDARFSMVNEVSNPGVSNYNGLVLAFNRSISSNFQVQASFTWSHALDDISNGGFLPFNFNTNESILSPQNPYNFKQYNYGNADYDSRKQFNLAYSYSTPKPHGWRDAIGNWTVSGVLFFRTGLPFTAVDGLATGVLEGYNYGNSSVVGNFLFSNDSGGPLACDSSNHYNYANPSATTACMNPADFTSPIGPGGIATFGAERRNQVYGPNFFDTDLTLMKNFRIPHWEGARFQVGAQAFNILNHPNFDQPVGNIENPQFGYSVLTLGSPTSIFGSALGGDASPRALQIRAQVTF